MTKYYCDVCEKQVSIDNLYSKEFQVERNGGFTTRVKRYDFCQNCWNKYVEEHKEFLENFMKRVDK